jgi:putative DNA primase/helicase
MLADGFTYPAIPATVNQATARSALRKFSRVYSNFPFKKEGDNSLEMTPSYAAVLAGILSLIARPALPSVPLFAITSPRRGTGKSKIAKSISFAAMGHGPTVTHFAGEVEFNKLIVPLLREADRSTVIDNVDQPFRSAMLNIALTENRFSSRILGRSEKVPLVNSTVFFVTGNNLQVQGDLTRRTLMVTIQATCEYPERRNFTFEPVSLARELHPELVIAGLTSLRGYIQASKPWKLARPVLGSFEEWDHLISGTLVWAGFADPLVTMADVDASDPQRERDLELLATWAETYSTPVTSAAIRESEGKDKDNVYALLCPNGKWDGDAVGKRLRGLKGIVIGGYRLMASESLRHGLRPWFVEKVAV